LALNLCNLNGRGNIVVMERRTRYARRCKITENSLDAHLQ
jgi:hypothetical protein